LTGQNVNWAKEKALKGWKGNRCASGIPGDLRKKEELGGLTFYGALSIGG
jgi:hypothetical protein